MAEVNLRSWSEISQAADGLQLNPSAAMLEHILSRMERIAARLDEYDRRSSTVHPPFRPEPDPPDGPPLYAATAQPYQPYTQQPDQLNWQQHTYNQPLYPPYNQQLSQPYTDPYSPERSTHTSASPWQQNQHVYRPSPPTGWLPLPLQHSPFCWNPMNQYHQAVYCCEQPKDPPQHHIYGQEYHQLFQYQQPMQPVEAHWQQLHQYHEPVLDQQPPPQRFPSHPPSPDIRYGSVEFNKDIDESVQSRQIHYDDIVFDRLLNRDQHVEDDVLLKVEEVSHIAKEIQLDPDFPDAIAQTKDAIYSSVEGSNVEASKELNMTEVDSGFGRNALDFKWKYTDNIGKQNKVGESVAQTETNFVTDKKYNGKDAPSNVVIPDGGDDTIISHRSTTLDCTDARLIPPRDDTSCSGIHGHIDNPPVLAPNHEHELRARQVEWVREVLQANELVICQSSIEPRSKTPREKTALSTLTRLGSAIQRRKTAKEVGALKQVHGVTCLKKDLVIDVQNFKRNLEESLDNTLGDSIHISPKFLGMENLYSSLKSLGYDIFVDVALGVKWIPGVGCKNLKVVVKIDKEIDAHTAAGPEPGRRHKAPGALKILTDRELQLGDVAVLDISAAPIAQAESTAQSIRSVESNEFQLVTEDEDKALPDFLNSVAGNFAKTSPEISHGQGSSRLLFACIVVDTGKLSSPYWTSRDTYMSTLSLDGASRIGVNGFYQILKRTSDDSFDLEVEGILLKDLMKWTMSDQLIPIWLWLRPNIRMSVAHLHNSASIQEFLLCLVMEKLRMLMVIFGYYDSHKRFKRDILVSTKSFEIMKNLFLFLHSSEIEFQLRALIQLGLLGARRVLVINKVASRRTILCLLVSWFPP